MALDIAHRQFQSLSMREQVYKITAIKPSLQFVVIFLHTTETTNALGGK